MHIVIPEDKFWSQMTSCVLNIMGFIILYLLSEQITYIYSESLRTTFHRIFPELQLLEVSDFKHAFSF